MKKVMFLLAVSALFFANVQPSFAQSKKEKKEQQRKDFKELIDSGDYKININRVMPTGGNTFNLSSYFTLEIDGDVVDSNLPYYGRAHGRPVSGSNALRFKESITDYTVKYKKRGDAQVSFKVKTADDTYSFQMYLFPDGTATINVTSFNKNSISYQGKVELKDS